jgi:menaquinol-cytochrome c reductase iron-sulfur subunit
MNYTRKLVNREVFIGLAIAGIGGLGSLLIGIPIIGVVIGPLFQMHENTWRDVGAVESFHVGKTVQVNFKYNQGRVQEWAGPTKMTSAWLRRTGGNEFTAFAVYCTHLGCPVHWLQDPQIFLCPSHGSVFNSDGTVAGGPAPTRLHTYKTRVKRGRVFILTQPLPVVT